jgi:hypothetical protein
MTRCLVEWHYNNIHHKMFVNYSNTFLFYFFGAVLLCVFTFLVPCCDVRYDFRIKTMFGSSLPPVNCRKTHVLFTRFLFETKMYSNSWQTFCDVYYCSVIQLNIVSCIFSSEIFVDGAWLFTKYTLLRKITSHDICLSLFEIR